MYLVVFFLFSSTLAALEHGFPNEQVLPSSVEASINIPNFDVQKATTYLESLHDYLKSVGGAQIYAEMDNKSEEERKAIQKKISELLLPITQNLEKKSHWCGGLGSIGLGGLFLALDDLLEKIATIPDEKNRAAEIFAFFKYLGCKDSVLSYFPVDEIL